MRSFFSSSSSSSGSSSQRPPSSGPQELSRSSAPSRGDICAALFSRGDGQTFHWAFMIIKDDNIAHKMHVVQHMGAWSYQSGPHSFRVSQTLVVLVKIGSLQAGFNTIAYIDGLLAEKIPVNRGSGHFTCRTWFMAAIRGLDDEGHIFISSISGLENELRERAIAVERTRGRRVYAISTCSY